MVTSDVSHRLQCVGQPRMVAFLRLCELRACPRDLHPGCFVWMGFVRQLRVLTAPGPTPTPSPVHTSVLQGSIPVSILTTGMKTLEDPGPPCLVAPVGGDLCRK